MLIYLRMCCGNISKHTSEWLCHTSTGTCVIASDVVNDVVLQGRARALQAPDERLSDAVSTSGAGMSVVLGIVRVDHRFP
jgi:hypothetical protein